MLRSSFERKFDKTNFISPKNLPKSPGLHINKIVSGDCETDFRSLWPPEVKDKDLKWIANSKEDRSAPRYRLFTTQDVRVVEPNLAYHCK